uniref:Retrotransposon gag domain-containing protein n=1 Tax=Tanacetum cinerariifolium TaxID=118510 RepID=A0A6L2KRR0_TANCI|nr:hypothetical protein [Tanacetum cinerariifolium]
MAMLVACHMFTSTLKDSARIWWNSQKASSILNCEDLKEKFRSDFSQQKRFTKTHLAVHSIKQREGESAGAFNTRLTHGIKQENSPLTKLRMIGGTTLKVQGNSPRTTAGDREVETVSRTKAPNKEIIQVRVVGPFGKRDKKKKEKVSETKLGERKEERKKAKTIEIHVLMISKKICNPRKRYAEEDYNKVGEITFPLITKDKNSANPVFIKAYVLGRQVNRVYMDSGSSCKVIYGHHFLKLKPSIRSLRVDS